MYLTVFKSRIPERHVIYVHQVYTTIRLMDVHIHGKQNFPQLCFQQWKWNIQFSMWHSITAKAIFLGRTHQNEIQHISLNKMFVSINTIRELIILYHGSVLYLLISTIRHYFKTEILILFMSTDPLSEELLYKLQCISFLRGGEWGKNLIRDVPQLTNLHSQISQKPTSFASRPVHVFSLINDLSCYKINQHNTHKIKLGI